MTALANPDSPALIAAAGESGYIQTPFLGDMAPAIRSVTPASFSPGQTLHVNIQVNSGAQPTAETATDSPPVGWVVSNVSSGGSFDSTTGQITWTFPAGAFPSAVSYDVTPPGNAAAAVSFVGYLFGMTNTAAYTELLGGVPIATPVGSRAASLNSAGAPELSTRATRSAPPPPNEAIDLSPTVPAAQFNADLLIVEDTYMGLTLPLAVHVRNGIGTSVPPFTLGSGE